MKDIRIIMVLAVFCMTLFGETREIQVPNSDTVLQIWMETSPEGNQEQYFSIIQNGNRLATPSGKPVRADYNIKLLTGDFDPLTRVPEVDSHFQADETTHIYIVQFYTQPLDEFRKILAELGAKVHFFLANHSHLVEMQEDVLRKVETLPFVRWVGPYHPAYRLEPFLRENAANASSLFGLQTYNIMLFESDLSTKAEVASRIKKMGGLVNRVDAGKYLMEATLTPGQLFKLVNWDEVLFVDRWSEMEADMDKAREYGGANYIESVAGFTGVGVRGEVFDAGFNTEHVDFASRPLIEHTSIVVDSHGASTSGIVFGDGTGNAGARGLLPDGQGIIAVYSGIMEDAPSRYAHTQELLQAPYYAVFQTSSVGSDRTANYTTLSADMDAMLFDLDIVHCQSQSNAGTTQSRPQAWAKNIISGGAVNHYETLDPSDDCWCGGGSIGPATDGRIKPDLCAYYDGILTTTSGSPTAYTTGFGGTSGATPIIAGHVGLFFDMWSNGVFGNPYTPGGTVFENHCHMTTAKAMMINTANPYEFSGVNHDLTRVHQGWGFPDLRNMYDLRDKFLIVDETDILVNMGMATYDLAVLSGEPAFKATLVFADPAGVPSSSQHRINDLSLKVTSPGGTVYWGNNGLLEGNWSTPDGDANHVDTVENVFVQNPEPGLWRVEVIAEEINQDGHVETPQLDADFSLVVSGVEIGGFFVVAPDRNYIEACSGAPQEVVLDVIQIEDYTGTVDFSVQNAPAGLTTAFSASSVVVPGQSILTFSDFENVVPGNYSVEVTGTSPDMVRTVVIQLLIAHASPVPPGPQSPGQGETNVELLPEISWIPSPNATTYHFQLATDAGFSNVILDKVLSGTAVQVTQRLEALHSYFWHVKAGNGCGDLGFSSAYSFVTRDQRDYFTEAFQSGTDLTFMKCMFTPDHSLHYYDACSESITAFPTNPGGGTPISLTDDSFATLNLGHAVSLYGVDYSTVYVGSNGYLTFVTGDSTTTGSLSSHFNQPRISAVFADLNPGSGGLVSYKQEADRFVLTFENVPRYNQSDSNSFQIEMFHDGAIQISWLSVQAPILLSGLSEGNNVPSDFLASDLSNASCGCEEIALVDQPLGLDLCEGDDAILSVQVTGTNPGYQWRKNGTNIPGAVLSSLSLTAVSNGDAASYDCVISGDCGTQTTSPAIITVGNALDPEAFQFDRWNSQDPCSDTNGNSIVEILDFIGLM